MINLIRKSWGAFLIDRPAYIPEDAGIVQTKFAQVASTASGAPPHRVNSTAHNANSVND